MVGKSLSERMNERKQETENAVAQIRENLQKEEAKKETAEKKKTEKTKAEEKAAAKKARKLPEGFQISLYLPEDLVKKTNELAPLFRGGRSELIKKAVEEYVARNYADYKKMLEKLPK